MREIDAISGDVLDLSSRLHRELDPGMLESVYETVPAGRLSAMGYAVARQRPVDIVSDGQRLASAFRIDLPVDDRLVVEVKSLERLTAAHAKQLLTYLRLLNQPVGLLINVRGETLKEAVKRVVNDYSSSSAPPRRRVNKHFGG